jgi:hypothetical protein
MPHTVSICVIVIKICKCVRNYIAHYRASGVLYHMVRQEIQFSGISKILNGSQIFNLVIRIRITHSPIRLCVEAHRLFVCDIQKSLIM